MNVEGSCHCGQITFCAEVKRDQVIICNCTDCQALSGSPYRAIIPAIEGTFRLVSGKPKIYVKTADSGAQRAQAFCPECGSPIYAAPVDQAALQFIGIRVGLIKQRDQLTPQKQLWCRSALNWAQDLSGISQLETQ